MSNHAPRDMNVFRIRNFRLVFFGALTSGLGAILYNFAVSFYILQISGNSALLQGLYLAVCGITMLVSTPLGGVIGDRWNKVKIMYVCDFLYGGLILVGTAFMLLFTAPDAHIAILFLLGIAGNAIAGIFSPASGALLPQIVPDQKLQQANAYFTIRNSFQSIVGIILAGVLYAAIPVQTLFLLVGLCFIASGLSETLIRAPHQPSEERLTLRLIAFDMKDGVKYIRNRKEITALLTSILMLNFFSSPLASNFFPYFVQTDIASAPSYLWDHLLTPELWCSVFNMSLGIGTMLGAAILSIRKQADKCGYTIAKRLCFNAGMMILLTLGYYICVRGGHLNIFLPFIAAGCFIIGTAVSMVNVPISTALVRSVDREKLSKVNSIVSIGCQGLVPIASLLAGALLQSFGCGALLIVSSAGFAVVAVSLLRNRAVREL